MKYTSATEETAEIERRDSFYKLLIDGAYSIL
jgi:hypothetical protein